MLKHADRLMSVVIANSMGKVAPEFVSAWQDRIDLSREKGMDPLIQPTMERWFTEEYRNQGTPEAQAIADMIATTSVNGYAGCASAIQKLNYLDSLDQITGLPVLFIAGLRMQAHHRPVWRRCTPICRDRNMYCSILRRIFPMSKGRWISRRPCRVFGKTLVPPRPVSPPGKRMDRVTDLFSPITAGPLIFRIAS